MISLHCFVKTWQYICDRLFVRSLLRAGVQPILDPIAKTSVDPVRLPSDRGGELVGMCECVRDVQGRKVK